ncbi:MAG: M28 family peptidase [Melioribacteraceae bacterium]|nr:M28 family peptidase [Melioribacteraceae bacterium]
MKFIRTLLVFTFFYSCTIFSQIDFSEEIKVSELEEHVKYLASKECAGRKPGTEGDKLAAAYIKQQLENSVLLPQAENGFQYFDVTTSISTGTNNSFNYNNFTGTIDNDFTPLSISGNGSLKSNVVFVGYGFDFENDSLKWHDYADLDVTGKWVMILRGSPDSDKHNDRFENYSGLRKKAMIAKDNKAAGVLFVSGEKFDKDDNLVVTANSKRESSIELPAIQIKRSHADKILENAEVTISELETHYSEEMIPFSFELETVVDASAEIIENKVKTQNVSFYLEGSDPILKNEIVILGGHFDHLGMGGPGSGSREPDNNVIHYGADDNASGVATIIELMERLSLNKNYIKRSILMIAFSGEEMGLLGSKYFTNNPFIDLKNVKCMLNFDMVGRLDEDSQSISLGGTGTAKEYDLIIDDLLTKSELKVSKSPQGYGPSDHASFYALDIPVLFFFTGIHDDYHTSRDTPDKCNFEGQKLVSDFAYDLITQVANYGSSLTFQEAGPKTRDTGKRKFKVTLGIMPDVSGTETTGLRVDAVMDGRPAKNAGMQKGDVIIGMEGKEVKDIYDYMNRLSDFKVGQRITVEVLRDGKKILLITEL